MKHLLSEWDKSKEKMRSRHVYFLLDFDGTLAPIRRDPEKVELSEYGRRALKKAAHTEGISVAVISGRSASDIRKRIGISGIKYVGNHGFEIDMPEADDAVRSAKSRKKTIAAIAVRLLKDCGDINGVIVENKGITLSMHYRMASLQGARKAQDIFNRITGPYVSSGKTEVTAGKKVLEVRPPVKWDKGLAALALIRGKSKEIGEGVFPVYAGDDVTDESAFGAIGNKGLTVLVGRRKVSRAQYRLKGTGEVVEMIIRTISLKEGKKNE